MIYCSYYNSPLGKMLLLADENSIFGCYFVNQKRCPNNDCFQQKDVNQIIFAKKWLDIYYSGKNPNFMPNYYLSGTSFQRCVWEYLTQIPYGGVVSYGEIARTIAQSRGQKALSAQAVGNAVGANPLSVFIPCHRVIGTNGHLTGYAGGFERKIQLLELEGNKVIRDKVDLRCSKLKI